MNKSITNIIALTDLTYHRGSSYFEIPRSPSAKFFLKFLCKQGVIESYFPFSLIKNNFIVLRYRIFIFSKSKYSPYSSISTLASSEYSLYSQIGNRDMADSCLVKSFTRIVAVSRPGRRVVMSYVDILRLDTFGVINVFSTNMGYLTDSEIRHFKIGGIFVCKIFQ